MTSNDPVFHPPDDRFGPVRREDLIDAIEADPGRFGPAHEHVRTVDEALAQVIRQEAAAPETGL